MIEMTIGWTILIAVGIAVIWGVLRIAKIVNKWLILSPLLLPIIIAIAIFAVWVYLKYTGAIS